MVTDNFMDVDSPTRVLFSSEVLGMGIDLKGLYRVRILGQFGTQSVCALSVPCLWTRALATHSRHRVMFQRVSQLFGRCGRDGKASEATLFVASDGQAFKCDGPMRTLCDAGSCLRMLHARASHVD